MQHWRQLGQGEGLWSAGEVPLAPLADAWNAGNLGSRFETRALFRVQARCAAKHSWVRWGRRCGVHTVLVIVAALG